MVADVPVPILPDPERSKIAEFVLDANRLRTKAWNMEQEALRLLAEIVSGPA